VTRGVVQTMLRARTAMLHARLNEKISSSCVGSTLRLRHLLTIHYDALTLLVPALEQASADDLVCPGWDGRARLEALEEDLRVLHAHPQSSHTHRPSFTTRPEIWGALYALEGSRLGNRVILRCVMEWGTQDERRATQFLADGLEDCTAWDKFVAQLDDMQLYGEAFELAALGAEQVFKTYLRSAEKYSDEPA
jgi:heme oxygenase (biliverdin-IX-beta and delta-forming)